MAVMLIARFDGDVDELRPAYDRAHALIMSRGGATGAGELRHHCAIGEGACTSSACGSRIMALVERRSCSTPPPCSS
jgi:hypothetical protein